MSFQGFPMHIIILVSAAAALAFAFIFFFQIPAWLLGLRLRNTRQGLAAIEAAARKSRKHVDPAEVAEQVMNKEPLRHLWKEYSDTLHAQSVLKGAHWVTQQVRSTVPAETFFNTQVLVDIPLRTEFFKHVPGIFTGIGILLTFSGLINALHGFQVTADATQLPLSVKALLDGVSEAFLFSAGAIGLAMIVTLLEKVAVTRRGRQVEQICQEIDALYSAGAGEEYLARLVRASEESATQTTQLKDSLVDELKRLLTELTERQIQASNASSQTLAQNLAGSIQASLAAPMDRLVKAVEAATGNQGKAVHSMLEDLLSAFLAKMDNTFGGQTREINDLLKSTIEAMRAMQTDFSQMLSVMSSAGSSAGEAMAEQLRQAMASAETRQTAMNRQMEAFVEQIRNAVSQSQSETSGKLQSLLGELHSSIDALVANLAQQQARVGETTARASEQLTSSAQGAIEGISGQVRSLVENNLEAARVMKETIGRMETISTATVSKMNAGAETMHAAAAEFTNAGRAVTGTLDNASALSEKLTSAATALDSSSRAMQAVVAEYDKTSGSLAPMLASLQSVVETAKKDAAMSSKLVADMDAVLNRFSQAQTEATAYLDRVSGVLEAAFNDFHGGLTDILNKTINQIDVPLASAVNSLSVVIEELAESQASLPSRRQ